MSTNVGPESSRVICPNCHLEMMTRTEGHATTRTHILALIMCLTLLWPCAACLYCTDCARNVDHYCSSCNSFIGTYER
ncbi:lipopolysaccharide-induced tumor necrosis factor-alpha factor homolog [Drosophila novamexicana]|uniref:lipopolysaccharide-induced tumor necrosis factor-alpha factor homolog n=1 Tax=Drosophila novamexicana TaxID=47314 RepID=UPI0011E5A313|nr:lipopolysaccharide-induced tumor necrosis factor-alpha factor homolog [Drosophila novamexicana]